VHPWGVRGAAADAVIRSATYQVCACPEKARPVTPTQNLSQETRSGNRPSARPLVPPVPLAPLGVHLQSTAGGVEWWQRGREATWQAVVSPSQ
jgi:hypothetical protein